MPIESALYPGEIRKPWQQKINPIWWLGNDLNTEPPNWFRPISPQWKRRIFWYVRNPFHNFTHYVIGVVDRTHWVTGPNPTKAILADLTPPQKGWHWAVTWIGRVPLLPFISYSNDSFRFYAGWLPIGKFGLELKF